VELSSTFKNIYAMAPGICDGLFRGKYDGLYFNFIALIFAQAVKEIAIIVERAGVIGIQLLILLVLEIFM